jgi:hypothetical protein
MKKLHYLIIIIMLLGFCLNAQVFVTGGGVGGWDPNGRVFLTSTDGINYSSTASFEVTGDMKIGDATGWANIRGYDDALGSGWPGGTLPSTCGDCGKDIKPAANGWYNVMYNINTKEYLFTAGINPFGPYPTFAPATPLTFEEPQTTIYYKYEDFGNNTGSDPKGGLSKIANPHKEGINTSNTVFQMIKRGASWSGSKFFTTPGINFSASKIVKVKIWSPRVGAKLKLKFEGGGGDDQVEVASTVANAWEELIFDFSAITMGTSRNQIVFQFEDGINDGYDPNTPDRSNVADYTWLIDDISLSLVYTTKIRNLQCGKTMRFITDAIQASPLVGATEYTFEVTRLDNNAVYTIVSPRYYFSRLLLYQMV